jgi:hypothetical protein
MSEYGDDMRRAVGAGSMDAMDAMTDDVAEALRVYGPHLAAMAHALKDVSLQQRITLLVGMAIAAAIDGP